jgi:hypothetical protein
VGLDCCRCVHASHRLWLIGLCPWFCAHWQRLLRLSIGVGDPVAALGSLSGDISLLPLLPGRLFFFDLVFDPGDADKCGDEEADGADNGRDPGDFGIVLSDALAELGQAFKRRKAGGSLLKMKVKNRRVEKSW